MLYNMAVTEPEIQLALQQIKPQIKARLAVRLSWYNPHLAEAIKYRSTHPQLYSSGVLASFYDNYGTGTYKQELLQHTVTALKNLDLTSSKNSELTSSSRIDDFVLTMNAYGIEQATVNSVTVDCGTGNDCSVILNVTLTYPDGSKITRNMSIGYIMNWYNMYN